MTWLAVFAVAFIAEAAADILSVYYQTAVRKLRRSKAMRWAVLLAALGWVDLGGIATGMPLSALVAGSLAGSAAGTYYAVGREQVRARLRRKQRKAVQDGGGLPELDRGRGHRGGTPGDQGVPPLHGRGGRDDPPAG